MHEMWATLLQDIDCPQASQRKSARGSGPFASDARDIRLGDLVKCAHVELHALRETSLMISMAVCLGTGAHLF
jgi:hypothetical protein